MTDPLPDNLTQRLDLWLFYARFFKSRSIAIDAITQAPMRINQVPTSKSHSRIKVGDILTFGKNDRIRVIEIKALAVRRGPASEAQNLYIDLSPPDLAKPISGHGFDTSRPTKKQRRDLIRLRGKD